MNRWGLFKRRMVTLRRIIRTGCINFVRNSSLSIAAIAIMVITLTIVLFSIIANATFTNIVKDITDRIDVSVYLKDTVNKEQTDKLIEQIKQQDNVKNVTYVSKEEALTIYKKENADNLDLLLAISQTDNPLPATIKIKPADSYKIGDLKTFFEKPEIKALQSDETSYSGDRQEAVDNISQAARFLRRAGIVGILVFSIISIMIIFNTIQMAIFNRRDEITIMRLLGANTFFIRGPFVVEAILYGIFSAIISVVLLNSLFVVSSSTLQASSIGLLDINYANQYFARHFWIFLASQLAIGIFIGATSSVIATHRYLKFKSPR